MTLPQAVLPQVDQRGVRLRANRTAVRLLPRVRPKMSSQVIGFGEALLAAVTLEGPLPRVPSHVLPQVAGGDKGLRADGADELLLPLRRPPWPLTCCCGGSGVGVGVGGDVLLSSSSSIAVVAACRKEESHWTAIDLLLLLPLLPLPHLRKMTHSQAVLPQVGQRGVGLRADDTPVRPLPGVRPGVRLHAADVGEALRTEAALVGQLPAVNAVVGGEVDLLGEGLRTDRALVGPAVVVVAAVGDQVLLEVALRGEGQRTAGALVGPGPGLAAAASAGLLARTVRPLSVARQRARLGEGPGALVAVVGPVGGGVDVEVTGQVAAFGEGLRAGLALEGSLLGVSFHMLC